MGRLTEYVTENCSKPFYRFRSDGEIDIRYRYCINIEKAIDKLAEYENTGLEPSDVELEKSFHKLANKQLKIRDYEIDTLKAKNEQLKHDLAVRDRALELACEEIDDLRWENADICDYEYNEVKTEIRKKILLEQAEEALRKLEEV